MPVVPSDKEEEYFAKLEFERKRKAEEERQKAIALAQREQLRELHYMHCPKCGMQLTEITFKGIKVDKCFSCEGLWLDAGELEQLGKLEQQSSKKLFNLFGGRE